MDDSFVYDHIVVGAGIEGSSTAYYLARQKRSTLLIDQFSLEKSQGSSQGYTRIIRRAYAEPYYARMMDEAYEEWRKIENDAKQSLYTKTGLAVVSRPPYELWKRFVSTLSEFNFAHEQLDSKELNSRFPIMDYGLDYRTVFDPDAGVLRADLCLAAFQKLFVQAGGFVRDGVRVEEILPGNPVTVKTTSGTFRASSIVICAGPWATELLPKIGLDLPLHAKQVAVFYWRGKNPGTIVPGNFPDFMDLSMDIEIYGLPAPEYPGEIKIGCSYGERFDPTLQKSFNYEAAINILRPYVEKHFPSLDPNPTRWSHCFYTETPDKAYILDKHPYHKNIVIGAGFSGTGFKMAPVVGIILGNMATNTASHYDLTPFAIRRFLASGHKL